MRQFVASRIAESLAYGLTRVVFDSDVTGCMLGTSLSRH